MGQQYETLDQNQTYRIKVDGKWSSDNNNPYFYESMSYRLYDKTRIYGLKFRQTWSTNHSNFYSSGI